MKTTLLSRNMQRIQSSNVMFNTKSRWYITLWWASAFELNFYFHIFPAIPDLSSLALCRCILNLLRVTSLIFQAQWRSQHFYHAICDLFKRHVQYQIKMIYYALMLVGVWSWCLYYWEFVLPGLFYLILYNNYASRILNQNNNITNSLACKVLI